jgi:hypothetical protein
VGFIVRDEDKGRVEALKNITLSNEIAKYSSIEESLFNLGY